jgi:hypothetical protein
VTFAMAASQNGVSITQQVCYIMILLHECSMIYYESKKKSNVSCNTLQNYWFSYEGKACKYCATVNPFWDASIAKSTGI